MVLDIEGDPDEHGAPLGVAVRPVVVEVHQPLRNLGLGLVRSSPLLRGQCLPVLVSTEHACDHISVLVRVEVVSGTHGVHITLPTRAINDTLGNVVQLCVVVYTSDMASKRTIPSKPRFDLETGLSEYLLNRSARERATYYEDQLKKNLLAYIEAVGELEEGGHRFVELDVPLAHTTYKAGKPAPQMVTGIRRQKRVTPSLNEDRTMTLLKKLDLMDECTEVVVVLNEDAVLAANYQGKITDTQLEALYDESVNYAFYLITEESPQ